MAKVYKANVYENMGRGKRRRTYFNQIGYLNKARLMVPRINEHFVRD